MKGYPVKMIVIYPIDLIGRNSQRNRPNGEKFGNIKRLVLLIV